MRYFSVCSGIEAATVAWHPLGWEPAGFSEIEEFPCAVLAHHYPGVRNYGDMTKSDEWEINNEFDVLVGGTPCQSFSVAGKRGGMDDPRGQLALKFFDIARRHRPKWIVWENVPGVLSSNQGRDFGLFLSEMGKCGYGFAYRILDAQHFGVPQRRRRVFVVGHLGDWRRAAAVLFERESLRWNLEKGGKARQKTARAPGAGAAGGGGEGSAVGQNVEARPVVYENHPADSRVKEMGDVCSTVTSRWGTGGGNLPVAVHPDCQAGQPSGPTWPARIACTLDAQYGDKMGQNNQHIFNANAPLFVMGRTAKAFTAAEARRTGTINLSDQTPTLTSQTKRGDTEPCVLTCNAVPVRETADCLTAAYGTKWNGNASATNGSLFAISGDGVAPALTASNDPSRSPQSSEVTQQVAAVFGAISAVRRLTPRECERLQGFPDDYTKVPFGKKTSDQCPDGHRYKALGNSMAVPVMRWIGARIQAVQDMTQSETK